MKGIVFALVMLAGATAGPRPATAQLRSDMSGIRVQGAPATVGSGQLRMIAASDEGMPSWMKWGLIGAAGGAIVFSALGSSSVDADRSMVQDAATGAAIGFVVVGGAVAFYNRVCSEGSSSRRAGLCGM